LPLLRVRKVHYQDILYSEGDIAEELFFIMNGDLTLFADMSRIISLPNGLINPFSQSFNVPVVIY